MAEANANDSASQRLIVLFVLITQHVDGWNVARQSSAASGSNRAATQQ
jgi:hypothetical protein